MLNHHNKAIWLSPGTTLQSESYTVYEEKSSAKTIWKGQSSPTFEKKSAKLALRNDGSGGKERGERRK